MAADKIGAVILAGGQGKRMESDVQKQYMILCERPLITYALEVFEHSPIDEIVLVTGCGETGYARNEIVDAYGFKKVSHIVEGGTERYHSVYAGLQALTDCKYVLIHDGARPMVTEDILLRTIAAVSEFQACVVGMPVKDTIKRADESAFAVETPNRSQLWQVQTPQAFEYYLVRAAYDTVMKTTELQIGITDDAMIVESQSRCPIKLIEGSYENLKVTTPEDLILAEALLTARKNKGL